jgi:hypothetical protein
LTTKTITGAEEERTVEGLIEVRPLRRGRHGDKAAMPLLQSRVLISEAGKSACAILGGAEERHNQKRGFGKGHAVRLGACHAVGRMLCGWAHAMRLGACHAVGRMPCTPTVPFAKSEMRRWARRYSCRVRTKGIQSRLGTGGDPGEGYKTAEIRETLMLLRCGLATYRSVEGHGDKAAVPLLPYYHYRIRVI